MAAECEFTAGADKVTLGFVDSERQLPLVVESRDSAIDLATWIAPNKNAVQASLDKFGAVLFRNFNTDTMEKFEDAVRAASGELLKYTERSSPRQSVKGNVYTSTEYSPKESIFLHNEQSYNLRWCRIISFYCSTPPATGGQTPLASNRRILSRIRPEIAERFKKLGYRYTRNFGEGVGLDWQTAFQTEDAAEVERYCRENQIHFEWREESRLRTWQERKAFHRHPRTGEPVWFNHATFFHVSTLSEAIQEYLLSEFSEAELPNQTYYGGGEPIEADTIEHLRKAYLDERVLFDWRKNDVLLLDNMLVAHAREPYTGPRKILVAMSDLVSDHE